jgi:hypothetical protein
MAILSLRVTISQDSTKFQYLTLTYMCAWYLLIDRKSFVTAHGFILASSVQRMSGSASLPVPILICAMLAVV